MEKQLNNIDSYLNKLEVNMFIPLIYNRNVDLEDLKTTLKYPIKYFIKDIAFENDVIKKYFIIDIRTLSNDEMSDIFVNFDEVQRVLLSDYFYGCDELYLNNLELLFLIRQGQELDINKFDFLYNMNYSLKSFMTEEELEVLLNKEFSFRNLNKEHFVRLKEQYVKLNHFTYISGNNNSNKTKMLRDISNALYIPCFSLGDLSVSLDRDIRNENSLKQIIYGLTGNYECDKYSGYGQYIYRLAQMLEFSKERRNPVIFGDLRWGLLDIRNRIKLIDYLAYYSYEHTPVVLTGGQEELIKKKVYKANIITSDNR